MSAFGPRIDRHLISDHGEYVVDEVSKHWAAIVGALLELFAGLIALAVAFVVPPQAWWLPAAVGAVIVGHASWRIVLQRMDRFVITNMRVFRVHGVLSQSIATMPLSRILDISVHKPIVGRIFGYGHFVFESAAQEQGLRDIRYVGDPDARGLTIQRVIQQAGLRGRTPQQAMESGAFDIAATAVPTSRHAMRDEPTVVLSGRDGPVERGGGADWLDVAERRERERLDELQREFRQTGPMAPGDSDHTATVPIDLPPRPPLPDVPR